MEINVINDHSEQVLLLFIISNVRIRELDSDVGLDNTCSIERGLGQWAAGLQSTTAAAASLGGLQRCNREAYTTRQQPAPPASTTRQPLHHHHTTLTTTTTLVADKDKPNHTPTYPEQTHHNSPMSTTVHFAISTFE